MPILPSLLASRTVTCGLAPLLYVLGMSVEFRNKVEAVMGDIWDKWNNVVKNTSSQLQDDEPTVQYSSVVVNRILGQANRAEHACAAEHLPNQTYRNVKDYLSRI